MKVWVVTDEESVFAAVCDSEDTARSKAYELGEDYFIQEETVIAAVKKPKPAPKAKPNPTRKSARR